MLMKNDGFLTNILTLAGAGLLILLTGLSLYFFRDFFARYIRFFLPIPPLAVAAYIYVYNMFEHFNGQLPPSSWETVKDVSVNVMISLTFFTLFTVLLILLIGFLKKLM